MKIAGIVIDPYKLPVFKRHLDAARLEYTEHPGPVKDTLLLRVKCNFVSEVQPVVEAAQKECAKG